MDLPVADARSADTHALAGAFDKSVNRLQVQIPAALADIVGMADAMPELRPATADLTNFCHRYTLPLRTGWARKLYFNIPGACRLLWRTDG